MNGFHISYGTGLHKADLPPDPYIAIVPSLYHWWIYQVIYPLALFFVKLSFLALYWKVFTVGSETLRKSWILAAAAIIVIFTITIMFVNAFECGADVTKAWSLSFPRGCNNYKAAYIAMASINIATDLVVLLLPIKPLTRLNLNRRKKYALIATFLIGGIAIVASCIRIYALWLYFTTDDAPYDAIYILLLSQIEINMAIVCASIPTLRPLVRKAFSSSLASKSETYGPYHEPSSKSSGIRNKRFSGIELRSLSGHDRRATTAVEAQLGQMQNSSEELILGKSEGIYQSRTTEVKSERVVEANR
ncbi:hypothetical protein Q7P37_001020 [Cladosporium fusiforme]